MASNFRIGSEPRRSFPRGSVSASISATSPSHEGPFQCLPLSHSIAYAIGRLGFVQLRDNKRVLIHMIYVDP
jgi:hypothetical protein